MRSRIMRLTATGWLVAGCARATLTAPTAAPLRDDSAAFEQFLDAYLAPGGRAGGGSGDGGLRTLWHWWAWGPGPNTGLMSSLAGSSSEWPSPGPW